MGGGITRIIMILTGIQDIHGRFIIGLIIIRSITEIIGAAAVSGDIISIIKNEIMTVKDLHQEEIPAKDTLMLRV